MKRDSLLDSLRGVAIIGIMLIHVFQNTGIYDKMPLPFQAIIRNGDLGVEITFIISAFLYAGRCEKVGMLNVPDIVKMILHKIIRIIPLYYISLIFSTIYNVREYGNTSIVGLLTSGGGVNYGYFFGTLNAYPGATYVSFLFLLWIIYPFYIKHVPCIKGELVCGSIIIALREINNLLYAYFPAPVLYNSSNTFLRGCICFIAGRIIYEIVNGFAEKINFSKKEIWILDVCLLLTIYILMLGGKVSSNVFILLISAIILVNINSSKVMFIIDNRLLAYIGRHTLALFLFHVTFGSFIGLRIDRGTYLYGIVVFVLSFVLTVIWDTFFEPIISKKIQECGI